MKIRAYNDADAGRWDEFVEGCNCGTFLHTRRFLAYHGGRFEDLSVVCEDSNNRLAAVFPAARMPGDTACVVSHPGATYGGLLYREGSGADRVEEMLAGIVGYYGSNGLRLLEYRSVPPHLHSNFSQADQQAIWKLGGELARRDLWNVLALGERPAYSRHHLRAIGRARRNGVAIDVSDSGSSYRDFHAILRDRLEDRYGVSPVHTLQHMLTLREKFPQNIGLWLAKGDRGTVLAGTWVFKVGRRAWHTQYIASTTEGRARCATHALLDGVIRGAVKGGAAYVSFGCSTEDGGRRLNAGLFDFKAGFGGGAVCHDIYRLHLT